MNQHQQSNFPLLIKELRGLNERKRYKQEIGFFDRLEGLYQKTEGTLYQFPGIEFLLQVTIGKILAIHQTFDSRQNILIQTTTGLYKFSEAELFGRTPVTNLTPVILTEEEDMSKAIIMHRVASGNNGGATVANTWELAPLNGSFESQLNPDGSAAAFASVAANKVTLSAGTYRVNVTTLGSDGTAGDKRLARLYNYTAATVLAYSTTVKVPTTNGNATMHISCAFTLGVATEIGIQHYGESTQTLTGFGFPNTLGSDEVYRIMEIIKTA